MKSFFVFKIRRFARHHSSILIGFSFTTCGSELKIFVSSANSIYSSCGAELILLCSNNITISGVCPWSAEETLTSSCVMDHPGCEFDSECDGYGINYKCCYNSKCKYGECKDINKVGCWETQCHIILHRFQQKRIINLVE